MKAKKIITTFLAVTLLLTSSSLVLADNHKENRINYGKIENLKLQEY